MYVQLNTSSKKTNEKALNPRCVYERARVFDKACVLINTHVHKIPQSGVELFLALTWASFNLSQ